MKHNMRTPCDQCPFRSNIRGYLTKERVVEIVHSVMQGQSFPCHKTTKDVENDEGYGDRQADENSSQCAGAEIFAAKHGVSSQMSRISERLGLKVAKLSMRAKVCGSLKEMVEVHCGEEETEGEPCGVCNSNCLAPAGYGFGGGAIDGTETVNTNCDECGCFVCDECSTQIGVRRVCDNCKEDE